MNILYIAHEGGNNFNGASRSLISIIHKFSENNKVFVIIPEVGGKLQEALENLECEIKVVPFYRWAEFKNRNPLKWWLKKFLWKCSYEMKNGEYINELVEYCIEKSIEIIHTNSSVVNIGAILSLRTEIPHIWHFREFGQEDFNIYPLVSKNKWLEIISKGHTKIICVSYAVKEKYVKLLANASICTIYNGIDFSYTKKYKKKEHDCFNVLISGLISEAKGQYIAIRSIIKLLDKGYSDINLYLAGRGNSSRLKNICKKYTSHFHFLGQVDDMVQLRREMDLELVCSRSEAFGRVTVEAMSCRLPVIGTRSGGTPELIDDNVTGFLFEKENIEELAELIEILFCDRKLASEMGDNAYRSVINTFTEEELYRNIVDVYKEVLCRH